jgi:hypothetical protein
MTFSDNGLILKNLHQYNSILLLHSLSKKYKNFSITTTIASESAGSGVFFNITTDQLGHFNGYAALISFEKVELLKYSSGSHTTLASHSSTFIKPSDNVLTVSRKDSLFLLFCNGYFLYSCCDKELPPGDCAIIIQPRSTTLFSNFEFQSTPLDSSSFKPFIDNFDKPISFGWRKSGSGTNLIVDSSLEIATSAYQQFFYTIDQPMQRFQMQTDFCQKSSKINDSSMCGITMTATLHENPDSLILIQIGFDNKKELVCKGIPDFKPINAIDSSIKDSTWKHLQVLYDHTTMSFYCNGHLLFESLQSFNIKSAGLFSSNGPIARFDNFSLKGMENPVSVHYVYQQINKAYKTTYCNIPNQTAWHDLLGRTVNLQPLTSRTSASILMINNIRKQLNINTISPYKFEK